MPRYRQGERENAVAETRRELVQAAVTEFAAKGYAQANINNISTAAGFSKGTIYNYFPSKQALMLALLERIAEAHVAFVTQQVTLEDGPVRRLQRFFQAGFAFVEGHPAEAKVLITTLYGSDAGFKEHMGRQYQPMFQLVAEAILTPGIEQGVFRQLDVQDITTLLMTVYLGTSSQVDESGKPYLDPRQVADFTARALHKQDA